MKSIAILVFAAALSVAAVLSVGLATGSSPAEEQKTYGLGWLNMAHVGSTQPIAQALSAIESNVGVVYYLSPDTGAWLRYVPGKPEVSNLTTMEFGQSYLVLLTAPTAMTIPTEATFLATPTACPAGTPCPDCPSAHDSQSAFCAGIKAGIEVDEVLLEIANAGLLVGPSGQVAPSEVETRLADSNQLFDIACQSAPLAEPSLLTSKCALAGKWRGVESTTMLYAPSAQYQVWADQFDNIIDRYCKPSY